MPHTSPRGSNPSRRPHDLEALSLAARRQEATSNWVAPATENVTRSSVLTPPSESSPQIPVRSKLTIAAYALLLLVLAGAGAWITLETQKGQWVIESEVDGVKLELVRDGKPVKDLTIETGTNATRIRAGEYLLKIDSASDQVAMTNDNVIEIKRGEATVTRIRRKNAVADLAPASQRSQPQLPSSTSVLQPGQELQLAAAADKTLNVNLQVMADYTIKPPLLGIVSVRGETLPSLEEKLNQSYGDFYREPGVELFFAKSEFTRGSDSSRSTSTAKVAMQNIAPAEPVYLEKNLDYWLGVIQYEHDSAEIDKAIKAAAFLANANANSKRRIEVAESLVDAMPRVTSTSRDLAMQWMKKLVGEAEFGEFFVGKLQATSDPSQQAVLLTHYLDTSLQHLFGLAEIRQWIEQEALVTKAHPELVGRATDLYVGLSLNSEVDVDLRASMRDALREASLARPRIIAAKYWLNESRSPAGPFTPLQLDVAQDVLADQASSEEDVIAAIMFLRARYRREKGPLGVDKELMANALRHWLNHYRTQPSLVERFAPMDREFLRFWLMPRIVPQPSRKLTITANFDKDEVDYVMHPAIQILLLVRDLALEDALANELKQIRSECKGGAATVTGRLAGVTGVTIAVRWPQMTASIPTNWTNADKINATSPEQWEQYFLYSIAEGATQAWK